LLGGVIRSPDKSDPTDIMSASAARCLNHRIRSKFLPLAGTSLTLRQAQHSKYRPLKKYSKRPLVEELCGQIGGDHLVVQSKKRPEPDIEPRHVNVAAVPIAKT
jgi:hypothetical protein